ncbi:MAG: agmatine deiminase family protein [Parvibaculum sp.]
MDDYQHSPVGEGFFLPGEWEPHARTWMQWPTRSAAWHDRMPSAYAQMAEIARTIAEFEPVSILVRPEDEPQAKFACGRHGNIEFVALAVDDCWARDTAPLYVTNGRGVIGGIAWQFNGWGNRVHGYAHDAALAGRLLAKQKLKCFQSDMVLEGGAVSTDGYGTLLVTEDCVLGEDRNPELSRGEIEERLALFLGARKIIWLGGGLAADAAGGHVSKVAVFSGSGTVLAARASDEKSFDRLTLEDNEVNLAKAKDASGQLLQVTAVPLPKARWKGLAGEDLALSYLDYCVLNGAVLVPAFGDEMDDIAASIIAEALPGRKLVQVDVSVIMLGGGALRRLTQFEPALP